MKAIQDKFIRENLMIQPVRQAPNPYIPNEADRVFVPKDDSLLRIARSLEAYNPNMKKWADRHEGELMEKARSQAMEELSQNGGLDHVKKKYFENPNLDGVNPYLHREIGKEVLRRKSVEYNAAMKFAYDEGGWGSLPPDEFFKKAQEFEGQWKTDNAKELSMVDSRDMPEIFGAASEATLKVVSEGYYRDKASSVRKVRNEEFQQRLNTEIRNSLQHYVGSKDYDYSNLIADLPVTEGEDSTKYDKVKAFLKDSDVHLEIVKTMSHYRQNLGMSKEDAFTLSLATLRDMATTDDGNTDAYIALASLLRESYDEFDANGKLTHIAMDKAEFAAWAAETEKAAIIAYQDRGLAEAKKAAVDEAREKLEIDKQFAAQAKDVYGKDPLVFMENNKIKPIYASYVNSLFTAYTSAHSAPIAPKTTTQQKGYNKLLNDIHTGKVTSSQQLFEAVDKKILYPQDFPSLFAQLTEVRSSGGGISEEGFLVLSVEPELKRMVDTAMKDNPIAAINALSEAKTMVYEFSSAFKKEKGRQPEKSEIIDALPNIVNRAKVTVKDESDTYLNTTARREIRVTEARKIQTNTLSSEEYRAIRDDPDMQEALAEELRSALGIQHITAADAKKFAVDAYMRGLRQEQAKAKDERERKLKTVDKKDTDKATQNLSEALSNPEIQSLLQSLYPENAETILNNLDVPIIYNQTEGETN